ncbi:MAG: GTPase HflX [Gammaproteobacteria bacterium RIFCSPLOWO2_02_FULL_61_13]|nr:MAG: GTPase HflX [Gammaproteobacteria bacterium RIFCSPLOWO2_02_FULL_61_13]
MARHSVSASDQRGVAAVLVHCNFRSPRFNEELEEFRLLCGSAGVRAVAVITGTRQIPDARFFVGSGKILEIAAAVKEHGAELIIFNHELSPAQERNVEKECGCRVVDRIGLILDIFAQRARSYEGKLQVELAQLQRLATRLVRGWTHLERQRGGIGLRGPGETQLEIDRRLIGKRIKTINERLEKVRRQRRQSRRQRGRTGTPLVSLVGYTNAGKSTLFNRLSGAEVYVADQLFATLDPTLRRIRVPPERRVILSDTVGFIRHLPHDLVESFRATLDDVREADLLLHVVDANADQRTAQIEQVNQVIDEIGAARIPQIMVYNKIDLNPQLEPRVDDEGEGPPVAWVSAHTGAGVEALKEVMGTLLRPLPENCELRLPPTAGALRSKLFEFGAVSSEAADEKGGWVMQVEIDGRSLRHLAREQGIELDLIR